MVFLINVFIHVSVYIQSIGIGMIEVFINGTHPYIWLTSQYTKLHWVAIHRSTLCRQAHRALFSQHIVWWVISNSAWALYECPKSAMIIWTSFPPIPMFGLCLYSSKLIDRHQACILITKIIFYWAWICWSNRLGC